MSVNNVQFECSRLVAARHEVTDVKEAVGIDLSGNDFLESVDTELEVVDRNPFILDLHTRSDEFRALQTDNKRHNTG